MVNAYKISKVHTKSFCANIYSVRHFRMIGIIDVNIHYYYGIEKVTLAFYSSSGTNNGKTKGLWYPIIGIKTQNGKFVEFTDYLNFILSVTTEDGEAEKGWLAKSLFFYGIPTDSSKVRGFSSGRHYHALLELGKTLQNLYEKGEYIYKPSLDADTLNSIVLSNRIYQGNHHSQRENFEKLIQDIFHQI